VWIRIVPAPELQGADVTQYGMTRWLERKGRRTAIAMAVLAAIAILLALLAPRG
jgi:hypothetical protein